MVAATMRSGEESILFLKSTVDLPQRRLETLIALPHPETCEPDSINTCYVKGMKRIVREKKDDDTVARVIRTFWEDFLDHERIPWETAHAYLERGSFSGERFDQIDGIAYHVLQELLFRESGIDSEQFFPLEGRYGVEENRFLFLASLLSPDSLLEQATTANRKFNNVTDFHRMLVRKEAGKTTTYCERVQKKSYLQRLETSFAHDDVDTIMGRAFLTTRGAIQRLMLVHRLSGDVFAAPLPEAQRYLNASFLEGEKYSNDVYTENNKGYRNPPYMTFAVEHDTVTYWRALLRLIKGLNPLAMRREVMQLDWQHQLQDSVLRAREAALAVANTDLSRKNEELEAAYTRLESETDQRVAAEGRAARERLAGEFAETVAHHGKGAVEGIRGLSSALRGRLEQDPESLMLLDGIDWQTERMLGSVRELRDVRRVLGERTDTPLQDFSLNALIDKELRNTVILGLQSRKGYTPTKFSFSLPTEDCVVSARYDDVTNALRNLVTNAYEAIVAKVNLARDDFVRKIKVTEYKHTRYNMTPEQVQAAEVRFFQSEDYTKLVDSEGNVGAVTISLADSLDSYVVSVQDTGVGIAEDRLTAIFEAGITDKKDKLNAESGSGLGLTIVKTVAERYHGKIEVESTLGVGSTFRFYLPRKVSRSE